MSNENKSGPINQGELPGFNQTKVKPDESIGIGPDGKKIHVNHPKVESDEPKVPKVKKPKSNSGDPDWWIGY